MYGFPVEVLKFMSADMTKAEQARHKLWVQQLKSRRAKGETDVITDLGDSIVTI